MKMPLRALPLLVAARAAARRDHALAEGRRATVSAAPPPGAPGATRPNFELVRRYVRR